MVEKDSSSREGNPVDVEVKYALAFQNSHFPS